MTNSQLTFSGVTVVHGRRRGGPTSGGTSSRSGPRRSGRAPRGHPRTPRCWLAPGADSPMLRQPPRGVISPAGLVAVLASTQPRLTCRGARTPSEVGVLCVSSSLSPLGPRGQPQQTRGGQAPREGAGSAGAARPARGPDPGSLPGGQAGGSTPADGPSRLQRGLPEAGGPFQVWESAAPARLRGWGAGRPRTARVLPPALGRRPRGF